MKKSNVIENRSLTNSIGTRSVTLKQMAKTRKDIRVLKVKKDLNTAIMDLINVHWNKAKAEGIIDDDDVRDQLLDQYLTEAKRVEKDINKKTLLIRLYKLEEAQQNLIQKYQAQIRKLYLDIESIKGTLPSVKNRELEQLEVANKSDSTIDTQLPQTSKANLLNLQIKRWPSSVKLVFAGGVILALTSLGPGFGMRMFLSLGSLLIGSAFFLKVFSD